MVYEVVDNSVTRPWPAASASMRLLADGGARVTDDGRIPVGTSVSS